MFLVTTWLTKEVLEKFEQVVRKRGDHFRRQRTFSILCGLFMKADIVH
jgi:hypothetical protein